MSISENTGNTNKKIHFTEEDILRQQRIAKTGKRQINQPISSNSRTMRNNTLSIRIERIFNTTINFFTQQNSSEYRDTVIERVFSRLDELGIRRESLEERQDGVYNIDEIFQIITYISMGEEKSVLLAGYLLSGIRNRKGETVFLGNILEKDKNKKYDKGELVVFGVEGMEDLQTLPQDGRLTGNHMQRPLNRLLTSLDKGYNTRFLHVPIFRCEDKITEPFTQKQKNLLTKGTEYYIYNRGKTYNTEKTFSGEALPAFKIEDTIYPNLKLRDLFESFQGKNEKLFPDGKTIVQKEERTLFMKDKRSLPAQRVIEIAGERYLIAARVQDTYWRIKGYSIHSSDTHTYAYGLFLTNEYFNQEEDPYYQFFITKLIQLKGEIGNIDPQENLPQPILIQLLLDPLSSSRKLEVINFGDTREENTMNPTGDIIHNLSNLGIRITKGEVEKIVAKKNS